MKEVCDVIFSTVFDFTVLMIACFFVVAVGLVLCNFSYDIIRRHWGFWK